MEKPGPSPRRQFLKGSLALGAVAAAGAPSPAAQSDGSAPAGPARPSSAVAQAESGTIAGGPAAPAIAAPWPVIADPGSDYMVDLLKAANIKYVAAMVGSTFRGLHESIVNHGGNTAPELIVCAHEEISVAIAHGYAKVAGEPIACLLHSTVGLQHASMAIYNAWCDRVPILLIAGNVLDATMRRPGVEWTHTASDVAAFVRDYVKYDDTPVSLAHFGESFMRAMQLATTPPYEPVLLVADGELQENSIKDRKALPVPRIRPAAPPAGDPAAIASAAEMLVQAKAPLLVADRLARTPAGMRQLVELAELLSAPVVDLGGRMNIPTAHPLNHTMRQQSLVRSSDVIVGFELTDIWGVVNGLADMAHRVSRRVARDDAKIIGISAGYAFTHGNVQDAQRFLPIDLTLAADGEACLPQLIAAVRARLDAPARAAAAARRPALEAAFHKQRAEDAEAAAIGWDASPISTARLSMEVWDRIKGHDWGLVSEIYQVSSWPYRLWDITEHHQLIGNSGGYGLGYGLPASIGAALAHRDAGRLAVAIQTDGEVMMIPNALWTLAHHNIPILIVMHNNRAWHQETMHLTRMDNWRDRGAGTWNVGTTITDPVVDFAQVARGLGVWAEGPIDRPERLGGAIDRALKVALSGKPALLDVVTQPR